MSLVGRKWMPIVYDRPTKQESTSLQKKKAASISFHLKTTSQWKYNTSNKSLSPIICSNKAMH